MKKKSICLVLLLLGLFLMTGLVTGIYGKQEASAATKGTVAADSLRVRTDAGTDKAVLTHNGANVSLKRGTEVAIQSEKTANGVTWYEVTFTYKGISLSGYISGDYVTVESTDDTTEDGTAEDGTAEDSTPEDSTAEDGTTGETADEGNAGTSDGVISKKLSIPAKTTADSLNVRTGASTKDSKLTVNGKTVSLKKGTSVKILKEVQNGEQKWYHVSFTYNKVSTKGYILSDYTKLVLTRDVSANIYSSEIKLRKKPGEDKKVKKYKGEKIVLEQGAEVLIIKEKKDSAGAKWYKVECGYKGVLKKGFIPANSLTLSKVIPVQGEVTTNNLRVRTGAGTGYAQLTVNNASVLLQQGQVLTVSAQTKVGDVTWYKVSFDYNSETLSGYVSGDYVTLVEYTLDLGTPDEEAPDDTTGDEAGDGNTGGENTEGENTGGENTEGENTAGENTNGENTGNEDANTGNGNTGNGNTGDAATDNNTGDTTTELPEAEVITDIDAFLAEQGFPESYKEGLKALHKAHPTWVFKAYHTGLDWETAVTNESKVGLNLITNNKANGWKSYEAKAYNYATDKFTVYDGSTWVTASKEAIAYYMDPRNFMTERGMFQFLTLEYQGGYENRTGVEAILANTPLYNKQYTYMDETTGQEVTKYYSDTFVEAAQKSGVSSYHLATRVKQEVVSNSTTLSGSATGTFSGYEGYYNFYNIGANHSTAAGGAIANGLNFAMGNRSSESAKIAYSLPWNNQYKAIVGGAAYIGSQYINRGQNTIYLQKFNVTPTSTYSHQYMANVEAANSEAFKLYNGYTSVLDTSLVFYIPVYQNMPEEKAAVPGNIPSPNNWLKSLKVGDYLLTPEFDASAGSSQVYVLSLELEDITSVNLEAVAANSKATIVVNQLSNGTSTMISNSESVVLNLITGFNEIEIMVIAENGSVNTYRITITK